MTITQTQIAELRELMHKAIVSRRPLTQGDFIGSQIWAPTDRCCISDVFNAANALLDAATECLELREKLKDSFLHSQNTALRINMVAVCDENDVLKAQLAAMTKERDEARACADSRLEACNNIQNDQIRLRNKLIEAVARGDKATEMLRKVYWKWVVVHDRDIDLWVTLQKYLIDQRVPAAETPGEKEGI